MAFRKVLKGFEIGGLPYTEVQFQLKRLLAAGASADELREILRRSELIEPLPEFAHREVLDVLNEAVGQDAEQTEAEPAADPSAELDAAALAAELERTQAELESEQSRIRELEEALAARIASEQTVRARLEAALQETERHQTELRAARNSLASRDKVTAQMRQILDERDAQLASLRREHAEASTSRDSRLTGAANDGSEHAQELERFQAEMRALRDSLASQEKTLSQTRQALAARDEQLATVQRVYAEAEKSLDGVARERSDTAQRESERFQRELRTARYSLASQEKSLSQMRQSLAERDADLAALRQSHSKAIANLEARAQKAEAELQAVQRHADAQMKLRESEAPLIFPLEVEYPPASAAPAAPAAAQAAARGARAVVRDWRWNTRATPKAEWAAVAIMLLAVAAWFFVHRPSPAPQTSAAVPAAPIRPGNTIQDCPTCPALTVLPAGRFEQGSTAMENASTFEKPLHWVMIAHPIALSTDAVTVDQFREFIGATGRNMQGCDTYDGTWRHRAESNWENPGFAQSGSHPVTCVSWNDAKAYAAWLSAKTGHRYRLPSASEWEFAARAGGAAAQPWSSDGAGACANANVADQSASRRFPGWAVFSCDDGYIQTSPVGSFKVNSFGLSDMLGNVFQWTEDCWHADYKGAPVDGSARVDGACVEHELRGGSWFTSPGFVRANYRNHFAADYRTSSVGIRLVREIA